MDKIIQEITGQLVTWLDELENETDFGTLLNVSDPSIREEAFLLQSEISRLKNYLQSI